MMDVDTFRSTSPKIWLAIDWANSPRRAHSVAIWLLRKLRRLRRRGEVTMTDIQAHLRFLGMSAQKVRLVVDLVRGRNANDALEMLRFVPKAAALPVRKLIASAVANAEQNYGVSRDDLYVAQIFANEATTR